MIENVEFWGLIFTIIAGDFGIFWEIFSLKNELSDVKQLNVELRKDMEVEFAKCQLHPCKQASQE